jgi:hypothetical protein
MALQNIIDDLQKREVDRLEGKILKLTEHTYPSLPDVIERTSQITGIPDELLVRACVDAAWPYQDLEWYHILDIIRSFHLAKKRNEQK